jgi:hypothetical protein
MEWLLGTRVGIVPISSNSVNDAIAKGIISKTDQIGFELEPDKNASLPVTFTWESVKSFKFVALTENDG